MAENSSPAVFLRASGSIFLASASSLSSASVSALALLSAICCCAASEPGRPAMWLVSTPALFKRPTRPSVFSPARLPMMLGRLAPLLAAKNFTQPGRDSSAMPVAKLSNQFLKSWALWIVGSALLPRLSWTPDSRSLSAVCLSVMTENGCPVAASSRRSCTCSVSAPGFSFRKRAYCSLENCPCRLLPSLSGAWLSSHCAKRTMVATLASLSTPCRSTAPTWFWRSTFRS